MPAQQDGSSAPVQAPPLGVQAERGYVQVVSPAQVKHEIRKAEGGLLKLEPLELPTEFRLLTSPPSPAPAAAHSRQARGRRTRKAIAAVAAAVENTGKPVSVFAAATDAREDEASGESRAGARARCHSIPLLAPLDRGKSGAYSSEVSGPHKEPKNGKRSGPLGGRRCSA